MRALNRLRPGLWRLVVLNSLAIAAIFVVLAASPAPVHFPSTHWEAVLLAGAALLFLLANLVLAAAAVARSIGRGRQAQTKTGNLATLRRCEHFDVMAEDGLIGMVDEVIASRDGSDEVLIVGEGWFWARRFYVPFTAISSIDDGNRIVRVRSSDREAVHER